MSPTRRQVIAQLAALSLVPRLPFRFADDPLDGTIADYQAGRFRGAWSAAEVTARALERCRTTGAAWRAIDGLASTALMEARASDSRLRANALRGPLDGVPVFAKSIYDVQGLPTTASNADWARLYPEVVQRDAVEVERLRAEGAVILGKTAADDFAYRGEGTSTHTGQVVNPFDATRTPGGSSAGSAVAVLGGMAFAALGTDDGGSNRIPAQCSGVVGMKPTFGLVPRDGVIPTWPYLDTHGPLARFVADAALMFAAIADMDMPELTADALRGVRLGIVDAHVPRDRMAPESVAAWDRALDDLRSAGAIVTSFATPVTRSSYRALFTQAAEARSDVRPDPRPPAATARALFQYFSGRTSDPRAAIRRGYVAYQSYYDVLPKTYEECEPLFDITTYDTGESFARSRAAVVAQLGDAMRAEGIQALIYPTMPFPAFTLADGWPDLGTPLGYGNWLGLPEVSVPAGHQADGLPALNLSIVGMPHEDVRVLGMAHAYEQASRRFRQPAQT
jgi:aspartyl-tRNA(Asn)/glutamyl-tRNA(Gln) amidotransferase subunit A